MAEATPNSIINVGDLGKPADTLIKKVSKAVGGIFAPYQITRLAKAEAEAALIRTRAEIEVTELHRRAMHRFIEEEAQHQKNMEDITNKALPHLKEASDANAMDDDWLTNFFDKARIVSDAEMQTLWSRVLAGEANAPGTYAKRTVNFLSDLDKVDAVLFTKLCGFAWIIGINIVPLVFDAEADIYNKNGIDFGALAHLESIGLIRFDGLGGIRLTGLPRRFAVSYRSNCLDLEMPKDADNSLQLGHVHFTQTGRQLAPICGSHGVEGFWDYVMQQWRQYSPKLHSETAA